MKIEMAQEDWDFRDVTKIRVEIELSRWELVQMSAEARAAGVAAFDPESPAWVRLIHLALVARLVEGEAKGGEEGRLEILTAALAVQP